MGVYAPVNITYMCTRVACALINEVYDLRLATPTPQRRGNTVKGAKDLYLEAKVQNLALTVLCVPRSLDSERVEDGGCWNLIHEVYNLRLATPRPQPQTQTQNLDP